jgi:hypothetical protein
VSHQKPSGGISGETRIQVSARHQALMAGGSSACLLAST